MAKKRNKLIRNYQTYSAESLCAELLQNGIRFDQLKIKAIGSFRKSYRNDIDAIHEAAEEQDFEVAINRDGIYDRLPEGLFHQPKAGSNGSLSNMLEEHRRYKEEEKQARLFFAPFEQSFFGYSVEITQLEKDFQFKLLNGKGLQAFSSFWGIGNRFSAHAKAVLTFILPWIKEIKGDMALTEKAYSMILGKNITITSSVVFESPAETSIFTLNDDLVLGVNTVTGNIFSEPYEQWHFVLESGYNEMEFFAPNQTMNNLLGKLEEIFVPLYVTVKYTFEYESNMEQTPDYNILGYGFCL